MKCLNKKWPYGLFSLVLNLVTNIFEARKNKVVKGQTDLSVSEEFKAIEFANKDIVKMC